jgi:hypothetical protein
MPPQHVSAHSPAAPAGTSSGRAGGACRRSRSHAVSNLVFGAEGAATGLVATAAALAVVPGQQQQARQCGGAEEYRPPPPALQQQQQLDEAEPLGISPPSKNTQNTQVRSPAIALLRSFCILCRNA